MKIRFNAELDYQHDATASIVDVFQGQEIGRSNFTVSPLQDDEAPLFDQAGVKQNDLGIGNRLRLLDEDVLKNVREVQLRNGLAPTEKLSGMDFTVEMETGTGKTYVYLRSIFELNQKYGFTKFIIVVPSVAIKEGVFKSLQMTEEHFRGLYDNARYDYFVYDSQKLGQVRNFATSDYIQIMVINIDAFRKSFDDPEKEDKANIIHRPHDRMTGSKPIEFIQSTNPVVIIDEPQSVDTTPKSQAAIRSLNPLCTLRYSATHVDKHNMMYKLDAVDAFEQKLVKQIEVAGITIQDSHNKPFIRLEKVSNRQNRFTAKVEVDVRMTNGNVRRKSKTVKPGDDLEEITKRSVYEGFIVDNIYCEKGSEYISFTSRDEVIRLGDAIGGAADLEEKRLQIRKTIEKHLDKELQLRPQGIKVLSLFFLDKVANYRGYDEDGNRVDGPYAQMFEDEYKRAIKEPKYDILFEGLDRETAAEGVHDGYFAIDKKKVKGQTVEVYKESRGEGKTAADESAYNTIMKNKEWLLSFECPLKFIFSHSALREGWDNPNVFQICTLNETASVIKKRQEIGRGLRIAVNQDGERVYGFDVNTLTVMANEAYEEFAEKLQKEIEEDEGIRFGVVESHLFARVVTDATGDTIKHLGTDKSAELVEHLEEKGYIDARGKIQDSLRADLAKGELDLPEEFKPHADQIGRLLKKAAGKLNLRNADKGEKVELNKQVMLDERFKELWDRIKHKTTFRVDFDPEKLIRKCAKKLENDLAVSKARFVFRTGTLTLDRGGVGAEDGTEQMFVYDAKDFAIPDIVTYLQNETQLTRRTIVEILRRSGKLSLFGRNPQKFMEQATAFIKDELQLLLVEGIKYQKIGDDEVWAQELFESKELMGYLDQNMLKSDKSVYEHVVYDSDIEEQFAKAFERAEEVKVYAKLPGWFKIETPLGSYNPDWAVVVEGDGQDRLYFVVETKGSLFSGDYRAKEEAKFSCGREHFKALGGGIDFAVANDYDAFMDKAATASD
ncbi:MAG: type III restriction endonuclease subunit R [Phycisphaerae bacterium]|nr:type III restriction endonuclease subunit R [Phycisphaerae bacterium]